MYDADFLKFVTGVLMRVEAAVTAAGSTAASSVGSLTQVQWFTTFGLGPFAHAYDNNDLETYFQRLAQVYKYNLRACHWLLECIIRVRLTPSLPHSLTHSMPS